MPTGTATVTAATGGPPESGSDSLSPSGQPWSELGQIIGNIFDLEVSDSSTPPVLEINRRYGKS